MNSYDAAADGDGAVNGHDDGKYHHYARCAYGYCYSSCQKSDKEKPNKEQLRLAPSVRCTQDLRPMRKRDCLNLCFRFAEPASYTGCFVEYSRV